MKRGHYTLESVTRQKMLELVLEAEKGNIFFRYQQPEYILTPGQLSWCCGYESAEEAEADGGTVEQGKSCMADPLELYKNYSSDYSYEGGIVVAFEGRYVGQGNNGEDIAEFEKTVTAFDASEFDSFMEHLGEKVGKGQMWYTHTIYDIIEALQ